MLEEVSCVCSWVGNINVPEDQEYDLIWECPRCVRKLARHGPKGLRLPVLPEIPDGIVSVIDAEYIGMGDMRG